MIFNSTNHCRCVQRTLLQFKVATPDYIFIFCNDITTLLLTEPTGAPLLVNSTVETRTATFTWEPIDCIESNGIITGYVAMFQPEGDANASRPLTIGQEIRNFKFVADGLTPGESYFFQVAGENSVGVGPYATASISTHEESTSEPIIKDVMHHEHLVQHSM